jgi:hypothetical protein
MTFGKFSLHQCDSYCLLMFSCEKTWLSGGASSCRGSLFYLYVGSLGAEQAAVDDEKEEVIE